METMPQLQPAPTGPWAAPVVPACGSSITAQLIGRHWAPGHHAWLRSAAGTARPRISNPLFPEHHWEVTTPAPLPPLLPFLLLLLSLLLYYIFLRLLRQELLHGRLSGEKKKNQVTISGGSFIATGTELIRFMFCRI